MISYFDEEAISSGTTTDPAEKPSFSIGTSSYLQESGDTLIDRTTKGPLSIAVIGSRVGEAITVSCQTPGKVTVDTDTKISMGSTAIGAFQSDKDADWFAVTLEAKTSTTSSTCSPASTAVATLPVESWT